MKMRLHTLLFFMFGAVFKGAWQLPNMKRIALDIDERNVDNSSRQRINNYGVFDFISNINMENDLTNLFEGDIQLTQGKRQQILSDEKKRDVRRDRRYLWHSRIVPYEIAHELENFGPMIEQALHAISSKTCIKFTRRTSEKNWIYFVRRSGCWSSVGKLYWRSGFQEISLGSGCLKYETVLHEVLHALGFWHEQSRPDRDKYIEIFWENIEEGQESNFDRYSHGEADILGIQYDYSSVMHYGSKAFSKNGKDTMRPIRESNDLIGNAHELSILDAVQLNALYDCQNVATVGWSSWSEYSPCNDQCLKYRQRFCKQSDIAQCDGANEFGVQSESAECKRDHSECFVPIDGNWGPWGSWSACSMSCGQGQRVRSRMCNDPTPKFNGRTCEGAASDQKGCKLKSCNLGENDCEFEGRGFCHWNNGLNNLAVYNWSSITGPTPSRNTGPNEDHTSGNGFYVYLEASSPAAQGYKAQLVSRIFSGEKEKCLEFYYSMYGANMGSLRVGVYRTGTERKEVLWEVSGDQGKVWKKQRVTIASQEDFQIILEGERGLGFKSDIAIDDVYIIDGSCSIAKNGKTSIVDVDFVSTTKPDHVVEVGCYNDHGVINGKRPFPQFISYRDSIDWSDLSKTISECAHKARSLGYQFFAVEFYGECWFGPKDEVNYSRDGLTNDCLHGVGAARSMMVYKWTTQ